MTAATSSQNYVGPCVRCGDIAEAVVDAARADNPGREVIVEDHSAYVRLKVEQELILRRATIEDFLGRPFQLWELQPEMPAIAGLVEMTDDSIRFYFNKKL
jgi:toluene monooxygenase system protein D